MQERRKQRRRRNDRLDDRDFRVIGAIAVIACFLLGLLSGCASHIPKFAPSSVQVCAEYSRDRALDEDYRRSRRLGASACLTFDDVSQNADTSE
jgi:hypothetical protein